MNQSNKSNKFKLNSPQDYVNLYKRMGCVDFISHFFHQYDDLIDDGQELGIMTRVIHYNIPYAISQGEHKKPQFCQRCKKWDARMVLPDEFPENNKIQEFVTICTDTTIPNYDPTDYRSHPRYYPGNQPSKGLGFIQPNSNGNNIWNDIFQARTYYASSYLWNPIVLQYQTNGQEFKRRQKMEYVQSYIPTMELDVKGTQNNRKDFLTKEAFEDMNTADGYITSELKKQFDGPFHKQTSGNGIYYSLPPIPIDKSISRDLDETMRGWHNTCVEIEDYFATDGGQLKLKNITFDIDTIPGWNKYFKAPFSLHKRFDRIALPLPFSKYLDYDYISTFSNPTNISPDTVIDIVQEAGYSYYGEEEIND